MLKPFKNHHPEVAESVYVDEQALVIGKVGIGAHSSIWPFAVARGDVNTITIGSCTNIQDASVLHVTHDCELFPGGYSLTIGDRVTVGHRVTLHGCTIGDLCLIGMGATIMDGAVIEDNVMVGAASLVAPNKRLVAGYLYKGVPAKQIRPLSEDEISFLHYSSEHYKKLKDQYVA